MTKKVVYDSLGRKVYLNLNNEYHYLREYDSNNNLIKELVKKPDSYNTWVFNDSNNTYSKDSIIQGDSVSLVEYSYLDGKTIITVMGQFEIPDYLICYERTTLSIDTILNTVTYIHEEPNGNNTWHFVSKGITARKFNSKNQKIFEQTTIHTHKGLKYISSKYFWKYNEDGSLSNFEEFNGGNTVNKQFRNHIIKKYNYPK